MIHVFVKENGMRNIRLFVSSTLVIPWALIFKVNCCGCLIYLNSASFSSVINIDQILQLVLN